MAKAWQNLDLEGGGLQAVNATLTRRLRSRPRTYAAWLGFPIGLHRFYLGDRRGGLVFLLLSLLTLVLFSLAAIGIIGSPWLLLPAVPLAGLALWDLRNLENDRANYNKALRMKLFLRKGKRPPEGYRGRYGNADDPADDTTLQNTVAAVNLDEYTALKEQERAGHPVAAASAAKGASGLAANKTSSGARRMPSFNEQEALLRQMQQRKQESKQR